MALYALFSFTAARAQSDISPAEARDIAVDAYTYFYPLLSM
jgi:hypothetical protein